MTPASQNSLLGVDLFCWRRKFLLYNFVTRNLKLKYRRSVLGVFWSLLVPLSTAALYYMIFHFVARLQIPNYVVFVLSGILPWLFFSQTLADGMESVTANYKLISKVPIPIQVFPLTTAFTHFTNLLVSIPVLMGAALLSGLPVGLPYLVLPVFLACLFMIAYNMALILSLAFVFFRDLKHLLSLVLQFWMYATPIMYTGEMIPERFQWILYANPIAHLILALHSIVLHNQWPSILQISLTLGWTLFFLVIAVISLKRKQYVIAEHL